MQCHPRESGDLVLEMRCLIKEIPACAGMTLPSASTRLGLNKFQRPAIRITGNGFATHFKTQFIIGAEMQV